jgi:hypothetical protein
MAVFGAQLFSPSNVPQTLSDDDISLAAELLDGVAFLLGQVVVAGGLTRETFGSLGKLMEDS